MHPPATQDTLLARGAALFNRCEYFAAHEAWEDAWRAATGDERRCLQGLIQCAVALEHARRGNVVGALRLAERYPAKFANLANNFLRLDLPAFLHQMTRAIDAIATHQTEFVPPILTFSDSP